MADPLTTEELLELANQLAVLAGRIGGFIVVQAPPPNTLGAVGAVAFDQVARIWYGPKTLSGWGAGTALTQGASAKSVVIQAGLLPEDATDEDFADWLVSSREAVAGQTSYDDALTELGVGNVQDALVVLTSLLAAARTRIAEIEGNSSVVISAVDLAPIEAALVVAGSGATSHFRFTTTPLAGGIGIGK